MTDLCHAALKFATLPLAGEVDRRTDPDALGNIKRLYQNSFEQRLDFSDTFAKPWNPVRRKTIGSNSEDAAVAITARVSSLFAIIERKRLIWSASNSMPSAVTGSRANTRSNRMGCIRSIRAAMIPPVECAARWQNLISNASRGPGSNLGSDSRSRDARTCRARRHRPAARLPVEANGNDPFVMALRRIEFESGRLLQTQILFLKGPELVPFRNAVSAALERRHTEIGKLWAEALEGVGITIRRAE